MEIKVVWDRNQLPDEIREKLNNANVFYSEEWFNYTKARNENICYLWSNTHILAIRVKKVLFLSGGILDGEPFKLKDDVTLGEEKEFLNSCCKILKTHRKIDWIQTEISSNFLTYPDKSVVYGAGNFILDIENITEEDLFKKVHSKNRNMIRRGEKEGIEVVREGENLIDDYKLIEDQVWERSNRSNRTLDYYNKLLSNMPNTSSIVLGYKDGIPEAGAIFLYTNTMGYYHHGASKTNPTPGAHNYIIWKQILYLKELGVKKINFVGYRREREVNEKSKQYGIQSFKAKFGGEVLETYAFKFVCNKFKYNIYRLADVILHRSSYKDAFDIRSERYPEYNLHNK